MPIEEQRFQRYFSHTTQDAENIPYQKPTKIDTLYIDSDGVVNDWWGHIHEKHLPNIDQKGFNRLPEFKRTKALEEIYYQDPDVFANLKPFRNAAAFILHVRELGIDTYFLTAAGKDHPDFKKVKKDKEENIFNNFSFHGNVIVTKTSSDKADFAGPGKILIDDFMRNCREWNLKGGTPIYFSPAEGHEFEDLFNRLKSILGISPDQKPVWGSVCDVAPREDKEEPKKPVKGDEEE